jgi:hypothetical protein
MPAICELSPAERDSLCEWIGDRATAVLPIAALTSGHGRVWLHGGANNPAAALVESALVPGGWRAVVGDDRAGHDRLAGSGATSNAAVVIVRERTGRPSALTRWNEVVGRQCPSALSHRVQD